MRRRSSIEPTSGAPNAKRGDEVMETKSAGDPLRSWIHRARRHARTMSEWLVLGALVGCACGAASALFLYLLDLATRFREGHEALVYTLPVAGIVIGLLYDRFGKPIKGGN